MKDRRKYERFSLIVPARLEVITSGKKQVFDLQSRNISAAGAFFDIDVPIPEGSYVKVDLTVASQRLKELTGAQSLIKVEGTVVRSTPTGVAVCFDGGCQILSLNSK